MSSRRRKRDLDRGSRAQPRREHDRRGDRAGRRRLACVSSSTCTTSRRATSGLERAVHRDARRRCSRCRTPSTTASSSRSASRAAPSPATRTAAHPTDDIEAYDLYLKGRDALRSSQDPQKLQAGDRFLPAGHSQGWPLRARPRGPGGREPADVRRRRRTTSGQSARAPRRCARASWTTRCPRSSTRSARCTRRAARSAEAVVVLKRALELAPHSDEALSAARRGVPGAGQQDRGDRQPAQGRRGEPVFLGQPQRARRRVPAASATRRRASRSSGASPSSSRRIRSATTTSARRISRSGEWEKGIPAYEQSLKLQPHWLTYSSLGTAYFYLKRYPDAVKVFEQAAALNPNDAITMGNLADGLRWAGQRDRALNVYATAISLAYKDLQVNPKDATTLAMVGLYQAKSGNDGRAMEYIRKARAVDPSSAALLYYEAVVHTLGGRTRCRAGVAARRRWTAAIQPERRPKTPSWRCSRSLRPSRACCTADGRSQRRLALGPVSARGLAPASRDERRAQPESRTEQHQARGLRSLRRRESRMWVSGGNPIRSMAKSPPKQTTSSSPVQTPEAMPPPAKCAPNWSMVRVVHRFSGSDCVVYGSPLGSPSKHEIQQRDGPGPSGSGTCTSPSGDRCRCRCRRRSSRPGPCRCSLAADRGRSETGRSQTCMAARRSGMTLCRRPWSGRWDRVVDDAEAVVTPRTAITNAVRLVAQNRRSMRPPTRTTPCWGAHADCFYHTQKTDAQHTTSPMHELLAHALCALGTVPLIPRGGQSPLPRGGQSPTSDFSACDTRGSS